MYNKVTQEYITRMLNNCWFFFVLQGTITLSKRIDEVRLLESRKSARLADTDTDFARLADMGSDRKRGSTHTIEVPQLYGYVVLRYLFFLYITEKKKVFEKLLPYFTVNFMILYSKFSYISSKISYIVW